GSGTGRPPPPRRSPGLRCGSRHPPVPTRVVLAPHSSGRCGLSALSPPLRVKQPCRYEKPQGHLRLPFADPTGDTPSVPLQGRSTHAYVGEGASLEPAAGPESPAASATVNRWIAAVHANICRE